MNGYDETKYISCKGCGCEIEADQRKCPYCKTINLSAPKKNSNKLLVIVPTALLVIAAVVVFLITSHAGGNDNILNPDKIKIFTVLNDSGTKSIGTRAELTIDKDSAKSLSAQEFNSFIEIEVSGSEYNWFTLILAMGQALFSQAATLHCLHMERLMTKECLNHQLAVLKGCSPEILCYLITLHYLELAIIFLIV